MCLKTVVHRQKLLERYMTLEDPCSSFLKAAAEALQVILEVDKRAPLPLRNTDISIPPT